MRSKRTGLRIIAAAFACTILLAACGGDDDDSSDASARTTTTTAGGSTSSPTSSDQGSNGTATVMVADTSLGRTLVDAKGKTIYLFENDTSANQSTCTGGCATTWPAVTAAGPLELGEGLDEDDFATFARDDGTMQVSVYGHPLYTYGPDANPGDTNGQGVGGVWFAVGADGQKIDSDAAAPSSFGY